MKTKALLFSIFSLGLFVILQSVNTLPKDISKTIRECGEDNGCVRQSFGEILKKHSPGAVALELQNQRPDCHKEAHSLGELALENGYPFDEIARSCGNICNYGCIHGALIQKLSENGGDIGSLAGLCGSFETEGKVGISCSHAFGHAAAETYPGEPNSAFGMCKKLGDDKNFMSCANGLLMQTFLGSGEGAIVKVAGAKDLLGYCSKLSGEFKNTCYGYLGYYGYHFLSKSEDEVCSYVPGPAKELCVYSLGERAYKDYTEKPREFGEFCKQFGDYKRNCLGGAMEAAEALGNKSFMGELCSWTPEERPYSCSATPQ